MMRNTLLVLSSAALLAACSQGKSDETAAPAAEADVASILAEAADKVSLDAIPALPDVVAKIDDLEIKGADLQKIVDMQLQRYKMMGLGGDQLVEFTARMREDILEKLVVQKILQREAAALNLSATDEDVDAFIAKNIPEGVKLEDIAKQQGMTVEEIKKDVKDNLCIEKVIEKQFEGLADLTDDELKAEYDKIAKEQPGAFNVPESVEASHILVKVEKGADEAAKAAAKEKIEGLRKQLLEGADFAKLAEENSDCPSGKRAGGSLGSFGRGQMVKPFEDAAFSQPLNEIGEIVETDFGFHIIKVTKKTEAGTQSFEDVKENIQKYADNKRKGEIVEKYIDGLKEKAKVETFLPKVELPKEEEPAEAPRELPEWAQ